VQAAIVLLLWRGSKNLIAKTRDLGAKCQKKFGPFLDLCVSSLRRGHANLLCIVPILSDVSEETVHSASLRLISWCSSGLLSEVVLNKTLGSLAPA
jgi:hypothetical protein